MAAPSISSPKIDFTTSIHAPLFGMREIACENVPSTRNGRPMPSA